MGDNSTPTQAGQRSAVGGQPSAVGGRRSVVSALVLAAYLCLAIATTHPLWLHLADAVPGDIGDPLLNTWILAWDAHALLADPLGLFDANIFYPLPNTLAYSEHLLSTAALILPLGLASGEPILAHNLSLLLSFPLAGLGMYLLVLRWTQQRAAAFLAGLAFAFTPYRLAAITHLQLLTIQWLPFSLLALEEIFKYQIANDKSQIARGWGLFIIFTTLQILASWYLAVFTMLVLGVYILGWLIAHHLRFTIPRRGPIPKGDLRVGYVSRLLIAALVVTALTLPFALPYLEVLPDLQTARPVSLAASFAARPADFTAAAPHLRIPGWLTQGMGKRPGFTEENALFLGLIAPLLALAGAALARPHWRGITLAVTLAVSLALTFAAPYQALTRLLPALTVVRVPPRWVIPATFALAALAGLGVARMQSGRRPPTDNRQPTPEHRTTITLPRLPWTGRQPALRSPGGRPSTVCPGLPARAGCLLLSLLLFAESFAAPLPLAQVGSVVALPPVYHALRQEVVQDTGDWGVVELPMHVAPEPEFPETKRMLASTLGWWGLVNGYSGLTPARQMALRQGLAGFPDPAALQALRELGGLGIRYLVVHPDELPFERARWEATERWLVERQTSLVPVGRFGPDDLYLVNPYGDRLITDPSAVTDPYWSTYAPTRVNVRFTLPNSNGEIRLLAYLIRSEDGGLPQGRASLPTFQPFPKGDLTADHPTDMRLTLYWQTSASVQTDYTVFVHSLDSAGALVGQADGPPLTNHHPTTAWQPGEIVQDSRPVPPGDQFLVGLYDPLTGQRLPAIAADGTRLPDDALRLYMFTPDQR